VKGGDVVNTEEYVDEVVAAFRAQLEADIVGERGQAGAGTAAVGREAAAFVAARHLRRGAVAERIGPVYDTSALAEYLASPGDPFETETVRKRANKRQLIAFRAGDGQWAFPAWQFDTIGGRLVPNPDVVALWSVLPHGRWMTDADLCMWMNTPLRSLGATPVGYARAAGTDASPLQGAVSRLHARVDGRAS
jgi:hypothetical protein